MIDTDYSNYSSIDVLHPALWHWALESRGRFLLYMPYNSIGLSLTTLKHGILPFSLSMDSSETNNHTGSETLENCIFNVLSTLSENVKSRLKDLGYIRSRLVYNSICREKIHSSIAILKMPGFSFLELQDSSYFHCLDTDRNIDSPLFVIIFIIVFVVSPFLLAFLLTFVTMYTSNKLKTPSRQEDEPHRDHGKSSIPRENGDEEIALDILNIPFLTPINLMFDVDKNKIKRLLAIFPCSLVVAIPVAINIGTIIIYAGSIPEYQERSTLLESIEKGFKVREILLDYIIVNLMYVLGLTIFIIFRMYFSEKDNEDSNKTNKASSNNHSTLKISLISLTFFLVFFRFSASLLVVGEILFLTMVGICMNVMHIYPSWINIIVGISVFFVYIFKFFDSYQQLYSDIYEVGGKIDVTENGKSTYVIFIHNDKSTNTDKDETPFYIAESLLKDIIKRYLPFKRHFLETFWHIIAAFLAVGVIAAVVIVIDQTVQFAKWIEYAFTLSSLALAGLKETSFFSGLVESRQANKRALMLAELEKDLKYYVQKDELPDGENIKTRWRYIHTQKKGDKPKIEADQHQPENIAAQLKDDNDEPDNKVDVDKNVNVDNSTSRSNNYRNANDDQDDDNVSKGNSIGI